MRNVVLALYRGMLRTSKHLSSELERAPASVVKTAAPPVPLQEVLPGISEAALSSPSAVTSIVRDAFRHNVSTTDPEKQNELVDKCFSLYRWMNEWHDTLSGLVYKPYSDTTVNGVRVQVQSRLESASNEDNAYYFSYHVKITNVMPRDSGHDVQLLQRHWEIMAANGAQERADGPGVVGRNPILSPGQSFQYSSGTRLSSKYGTMRGTYEFFRHEEGVSVDEALSSPSFDREFNVDIGPFGLGSYEAGEELQQAA